MLSVALIFISGVVANKRCVALCNKKGCLVKLFTSIMDFVANMGIAFKQKKPNPKFRGYSSEIAR